VATRKRTRKGILVSEQNTEQQVQVRQVTDVQASWTEHERGEPGSFTIQLILDDGAEEYILLPTADDAKIMLKLFRSTDAVYFDLGNKVLIPSDVF
jgi:predicted aspartyl protease